MTVLCESIKVAAWFSYFLWLNWYLQYSAYITGFLRIRPPHVYFRRNQCELRYAVSVYKSNLALLLKVRSIVLSLSHQKLEHNALKSEIVMRQLFIIVHWKETFDRDAFVLVFLMQYLYTVTLGALTLQNWSTWNQRQQGKMSCQYRRHLWHDEHGWNATIL